MRNSGGGALALYLTLKRSEDNLESASTVAENPEQVSGDLDEASATLAEVAAFGGLMDGVGRLDDLFGVGNQARRPPASS